MTPRIMVRRLNTAYNALRAAAEALEELNERDALQQLGQVPIELADQLSDMMGTLAELRLKLAPLVPLADPVLKDDTP